MDQSEYKKQKKKKLMPKTKKKRESSQLTCNDLNANLINLISNKFIRRSFDLFFNVKKKENVDLFLFPFSEYNTYLNERKAQVTIQNISFDDHLALFHLATLTFISLIFLLVKSKFLDQSYQSKCL